MDPQFKTLNYLYLNNKSRAVQNPTNKIDRSKYLLTRQEVLLLANHQPLVASNNLFPQF